MTRFKRRKESRRKNKIFCDPLKSSLWETWSHCYIITEWFFYINHFSLIIFYHSVLVGLWTIRLSAGAGAHIEYSSCSHAEDMTITNVIIKTPDRKWNWGVNDIMPGSDGLRIWVFWKSSWLRFESGPGQSTWRVDCGWYRNSQHSKDYVSLSSCRKTKSQEVNKRFVPEQRELSVFREFPCIWLYCNVCVKCADFKPLGLVQWQYTTQDKSVELKYDTTWDPGNRPECHDRQVLSW